MERPYLVPYIGRLDKCTGGGAGIPETTAEPTGDTVRVDWVDIVRELLKVGTHLTTPRMCLSSLLKHRRNTDFLVKYVFY